MLQLQSHSRDAATLLSGRSLHRLTKGTGTVNAVGAMIANKETPDPPGIEARSTT